MKISVIVPAFRENAAAAQSLHQLAFHPRIFELVVAAHRCSPAFSRLLKKHPKVRLHETLKRGRGPQMNDGAAAARGDLFLFLHADSRPEHGSVEEMDRKMRVKPWVGGSFKLSIDHPALKYRWKERAVDFRSRFFGIPYGDQGYFVRRELFNRMGGFKGWPLFEDVDFFDRMRKLGPWVLLDSRVTTSARRWEKQGYWKATFKNAFLMFLYKLGASPHWLAKVY